MSLRGALYRLHWEARSQASGSGLMPALRLVQGIERWPRSRIEALRDGKLRRLVAHSYERSPGYRRMMDDRGVRPADIRGVGDLPKLPILTKEILRERAAELRCRGDVPVEWA